jgi:hypothetical protein
MPPSAIADGSDGRVGVGLVILLAVIIVAVGLVLILSIRRRRVFNASTALKELEALNVRLGPLVPSRPPLRFTFREVVNSKSKLDRFDLSRFMTRCVMESEAWFEQEIDLRVAATRYFTGYHHDFEALASQWLGHSNHPKVRAKRFKAIESKAFNRGKLPYPAATAEITATVHYTSPKGQNSYTRPLQWNFDQLVAGIQSAQATRSRQSTQEYLRQRERSLMTADMRMKILRRDEFRCRMCGARREDGATLHVDHILPVSRGGTTVVGNLQTLCDTCNYGKSNKFVG